MSSPRSELIDRSGEGMNSSQSDDGAADWGDVAAKLREGSGTSWLSVSKRSGGVHTRPLFAAWGGHSFIFATKDGAAKTVHLEAAPAASIAIDLGTLHLVAEGAARRLTHPGDLARASAVLLEVFEWPTEVEGDELDAPYAAPTSGGPPFQAWELTPRRAYAFPTEDQFEPTRFVFES